MLERDVKYLRCELDRRILTNRMIKNGECVGHRLRIAGYVSFFEWIKIRLFVDPYEYILEKLNKK